MAVPRRANQVCNSLKPIYPVWCLIIKHKNDLTFEAVCLDGFKILQSRLDKQICTDSGNRMTESQCELFIR